MGSCRYVDRLDVGRVIKKVDKNVNVDRPNFRAMKKMRETIDSDGVATRMDEGYRSGRSYDESASDR